jgi:transcriptional regulator with XRE-family HTH domain
MIPFALMRAGGENRGLKMKTIEGREKGIINRIIDIRKSKRLTQWNVAQLTDIKPERYSRIERGQTHMWLSELEKVCKALNVTPDQVFRD